MSNNNTTWRDFGMVICDPLADMHPKDDDLWLSLIFLAINHNEIALASTLIAARQFGQRVEPSPKFGYRLTKPEYFADYFDSVYKTNRGALIAILRELANDFPTEVRNEGQKSGLFK